MTSALTISERSVAGVTVLTLKGDLKSDSGAKEFTDRVRALLGQERTALLADVSGVGFVDSAGLGAIVQGYATAKRQGGAMKLLNPPKRLRDLLVITKLATVLPMFEDEPTAISSFR
jgi:anti-sigma B factor antagonist